MSEDERDYPAEEQGREIRGNIVSGADKNPEEETSEEISQDMEHGDKDEDVYTKEGREKLEEDGEIEPWEEGFMEGAAQAGQLGKDALTGESLMDVEDVVETEIDGTVYRFVSEENAVKFREQKESENL